MKRITRTAPGPASANHTPGNGLRPPPSLQPPVPSPRGQRPRQTNPPSSSTSIDGLPPGRFLFSPCLRLFLRVPPQHRAGRGAPPPRYRTMVLRWRLRHPHPKSIRTTETGCCVVAVPARHVFALAAPWEAGPVMSRMDSPWQASMESAWRRLAPSLRGSVVGGSCGRFPADLPDRPAGRCDAGDCPE